MSKRIMAQTYQDAVLSGLTVPTLKGAFAQCRREGSIVLDGNWFQDRVAVLVPDHRDVLLYLVDSVEDAEHPETASGRSVFNMKELLWVNSPSLNSKAVDPDSGEPFGFDLIFRTTTLTLTEGITFDNAELANSTHQLQQVLLRWKPLVRSANLLKINRFGAEQKRWFMLENNVDLSWYKNRFAVHSRNAVRIDTLLKVAVPSSNAKARKYPLSADLVFSEFKKDKTYHLAASGEPGSVDLLQHIISHWTIEDLHMSPPSAEQGTDVVCFIDLHIKTVNSKLATSPEDFGFQCKVFGREPNAPQEFFGQAEPHVRVIDFLSPLEGHKGPAEHAGMWMHDAVITVDGRKIANLAELTQATSNRSSITVRVARLPFQRNVATKAWKRIVSREKARRLTLGYQRDWDDSGVNGSREAKKHSRQRWERNHKKTEFRQLAARERDDEPLPGGRRVRLDLRRTISQRHHEAMEQAETALLDSPRLSDVAPPKGPPPLELEGAKGAAARRIHPPRVDTSLRKGLPGDGGAFEARPSSARNEGWAAVAPAGSPFATLRRDASTPGIPPSAPRTPGGPGEGVVPLVSRASTPQERTRILSDAGRALFGASQKTFRLDNGSRDDDDDGEHGTDV